MLNKVKLYSLTIASIILLTNASLANPNQQDEIKLDNRMLYIQSPSIFLLLIAIGTTCSMAVCMYMIETL